MTPAVIRVALVDDHPIFRDGLRMLIAASPGLEVAGESGNGEDALRMIEETTPDVVLLDLTMPRMNGLDVLEALSKSPKAPSVVLLTASIDRADMVRALQLGARGIILKESATRLLYACVQRVMAGEYWVAHSAVGDMVEAMRRLKAERVERPTGSALLTAREQAIVAAVAEAQCNKDISQRLNISEQTVKNHLRNIYRKLGLSSRLELLVWTVKDRDHKTN
jgi:two-component system nitrate/nitrite response regulator NarL